MSTEFLTLQPVPALIGGRPLRSSSYTFDVIRPELGDKSKVHSVVGCDVKEAKEAVEAAAKALPEWKGTSFVNRRSIFLKAAELLRSRAEKYAQLTAQETCLDTAFANFEIQVLGVPALEETGSVITTALRGEIPVTGSGRREIVQREPFGVVVGIAPWNAPFFLALRAVINPLAAGNTVVLKTSEHSPRTNMAIAQLLYDAGLPTGALSVVHSDPAHVADVTQALISHPAVRKINFTGSTRVGRLIAKQAAEYLKPCVLELGGKAPQIVLDDADLHLAANNALFGAFNNSGQICMATTIILVDHKVEQAFLQEVSKLWKENKDAITNLQKAPGLVRALFTPASAKRAQEILDSAITDGAKVHEGDSLGPGTNLERGQIAPAVVSRVSPQMRLFQEEAFAPLLAVTPYKTVEEAIALANSNTVGLAASVFGANESRAFEVAQQIEAGQVHINSMTIHDHPAVPHGGWKESGYGRFNGAEGLREFTQTRTITTGQPHELPFFLV